MQIENQFEIPVPPALAWPVLMDVPQTAACFPGASMIEKLGADRYKGRVTVKLGPMTMVFAGNLRIEARDDAALHATLKASWNETRGRGNAVTTTRFVLQAQGEGTRVLVQTELALAGQVAQYGRGAGMISAISAQLIADFAANLRARIQAAQTGAPPTENQAAAPISAIRVVAQAVKSQFKR
jgi:carbon monoxide dehydrogenase subunit G